MEPGERRVDPRHRHDAPGETLHYKPDGGIDVQIERRLVVDGIHQWNLEKDELIHVIFMMLSLVPHDGGIDVQIKRRLVVDGIHQWNLEKDEGWEGSSTVCSSMGIDQEWFNLFGVDFVIETRRSTRRSPEDIRGYVSLLEKNTCCSALVIFQG